MIRSHATIVLLLIVFTCVALYAFTSPDTSLCGSASVITKKDSTDTNGCSGSLYRRGDSYYCCACKDSNSQYDEDKKACTCDEGYDRSSGTCQPKGGDPHKPHTPTGRTANDCICGYYREGRHGGGTTVSTSVEKAVNKTCDAACKLKGGFDYRSMCTDTPYTTWNSDQTCSCNLSGYVSTEKDSLLALSGKLMCWCKEKKKGKWSICPHLGIKKQDDANRCRDLCH